MNVYIVFGKTNCKGWIVATYSDRTDAERHVQNIEDCPEYIWDIKPFLYDPYLKFDANDKPTYCIITQRVLGEFP